MTLESLLNSSAEELEKLTDQQMLERFRNLDGINVLEYTRPTPELKARNSAGNTGKSNKNNADQFELPLDPVKAAKLLRAKELAQSLGLESLFD